MSRIDDLKAKVPEGGGSRWFIAISVSLLVLIINLTVHSYLLTFIATTGLNPIIVAILAILWGVIGIYVLFFSINFSVELYPDVWSQRFQPYVFIGPGILLLAWLLLLPAVRTLNLSFMDRFGEVYVGLANYAYVFTDRAMLLALQNTVLWVIVGTISCVGLGLLIAILIDRCSYERFAKLLIFMPIAVSFVGASVIWRFVYAFNPGGQTQIGLLNAIVVALGGEPKAWLTMLQPWNNFFLMVILIWMMTGFAMVMFSAAIKDVPNEILEAARVDGASEVRSFFVIIIPYIKGTIIAVTTSITIFSMRVFDAVWVMTGGQYGTDVIGTVFYKEYFTFNNSGTGSAIAMLLLIAVIPVILLNVLRAKEEGF